METFGLLRIRYPSFCEEEFVKSIDELKDTKYIISAKDSDAPGVTHCVSAVRYILGKSTGWLPHHYYVGDMCRKILDNPAIDAQLIPLEQGEMGDLIFFYRKSVAHRAYMIAHVGILVDEDSFFHSSGSGGKVENIDTYIGKGGIATCKTLSRLTDPRGKAIQRVTEIF